ncbi:gamma-glutamylcyclotransferase [Phormidium sp. FACHB-592]|uniref:Gamma-glutamylcyclotransferase n=1 Tax=Stenomitos frigidus AS-A4 TaxID=2933935 RepID=A0ABV0KCK5_9CYAN|nr:gamma-glutamylcyclotransferase [Phormidium sp. FACHB-592]MBD2077587.1 gamma-glutamylcyclotransferase [Phormidium sp. FACHB-592]
MFHVFVYGTLKPGESNHQICASSVLEARPAIAQGQLYALPFGYPAMVLSTTTWDRSSIVHGILLSFADSGILDVLDTYEQHDPEIFRCYVPHLVLAQHQYDRTQIKAYDQAQRFLGFAWSYVMSLEQIKRLGGTYLPSGQWQQSEQYYAELPSTLS